MSATGPGLMSANCLLRAGARQGAARAASGNPVPTLVQGDRKFAFIKQDPRLGDPPAAWANRKDVLTRLPTHFSDLGTPAVDVQLALQLLVLRRIYVGPEAAGSSISTVLVVNDNENAAPARLMDPLPAPRAQAAVEVSDGARRRKDSMSSRLSSRPVGAADAAPDQGQARWPEQVGIA